MGEHCPHCGCDRQADLAYYVCGVCVEDPTYRPAACGELARCYAYIDAQADQIARLTAWVLGPKVRAMLDETREESRG